MKTQRHLLGLPCDSESTCNAEDTASNPRSGRSPAGGNGNPFQYSCLENPMERGALQATVYCVTKSHTGHHELETSSGMIILK